MLLSCPLCCKPCFKEVDSLRTTLINVTTAPVHCPVCQEILKGLDKLAIHLFDHVNDSGCVKKQENDITETTPSNGINKDQSDTCQGGISSIKDQQTGQKFSENITKQPEDQNKSDDIIFCDICSFTFTDRSILDMHQKLLHQTTPDKETGKCSYHCHLCSKRFIMRGSLMVHLRVAHYGFSNHRNLSLCLPSRDKNSEKFQENKTLGIDHVAKSTTKPQNYKQWSCDICAKMFTTKYFLKIHKRLHTGEMPYTCKICNKSFTFQQSYHKHMLYHSSEKPYECKECGRAFKEHSTLQNHARIHSGERPFDCEICGKKFRQRVSYFVHMRIHTGVMPYRCTSCNQHFRYKLSQKSHKCSMNPPGTVIQVNESDAKSSITLLSKHLATNQISQNNKLSVSLTTLKNLPQQNNANNNRDKCIMTVDYDTADINLIPEIPGNPSVESRKLQSITIDYLKR